MKKRVDTSHGLGARGVATRYPRDRVSHQGSLNLGRLLMALTDRRCDVPEMSASSAPKPSETALRCGCNHALCINGIALRARRNPTTF